MSGLTLLVRRTIRATPERLFAAWTEPAQLRRWWGPAHVACAAAEIDLRVGGRYRLANQFPDGSVWWIGGTFETVTPPYLLVYSWELSAGEIAPGGSPPPAQAAERVTVRFEPRGGATELVVMHERIADAAARSGHRQGWLGCLDGLVEFLKSPAAE
jgi:uncharacterized protein YndB with AHSA1/START domain